MAETGYRTGAVKGVPKTPETGSLKPLILRHAGGHPAAFHKQVFFERAIQTKGRNGLRLHSILTEASIGAQGQYVNEPGGLLARRRHQRGSLLTRVIRAENGTILRTVWVGRWREDEIANGRLRRVRRSEVLGEKKEGDLPTRALARRRLEERLALVNDPMYRARPSSTFAEFAKRWEVLVVIQHKPSTQANLHSHLRKYITPFFGPLAVRDVRPETVQQFISSIKANPKTVRNIYVTLQMMWKSARAWQYVAHDALDGVVLPKRRKPRRFFFTQEEVSRILGASEEPYRTFYWLAAELGLRAGEICGCVWKTWISKSVRLTCVKALGVENSRNQKRRMLREALPCHRI